MPNRLAKEKSPYLLQHKDNPVDWYPWGKEAFEKAKAEEKPVFLSIGYSTCHWCHVMEHESFEKEDVAEVLNRGFVAIKVDREERPDVDDIYMSAVQAMTGTGGWPLSLFLMPDGKPFYGGTYFPPEDRYGRPGFVTLLNAISQAWKNRRGELESSAADMLTHLESGSKGIAGGAAVGPGALEAAVLSLRAQFDARHGGFGGAPKFPPAMRLDLLIRDFVRTGEPAPRDIVRTTLAKMAAGGMYDQVGGGFHRYSVDERWLVPHFEKMLYDNAMLARVYVLAWRAFGDPDSARIARETLDYLLAEMTPGSGGGFYAAQDADSEGREGLFYVWDPESLEAAVGRDAAPIVAARFGVTPEGNFEDRQTVLSIAAGIPDLAERFGRSEGEISRILEDSRRRMYEVRSRRIWPGRDEKLLTDWTALAISAFALAGRVLSEPRYEEAARTAADRILRDCRKDGQLLHRQKDGEAGIPGFASDYANFVEALLDLYEATFEPAYFRAALELQGELDRLFFDPSGGYFLAAESHDGLVLRPREIFDGATPSSNSVAAMNLLRLSSFTGDQRHRERAERVFSIFSTYLERAGTALPRMLAALDYATGDAPEIVLSGDPGRPDFEALREEVFATPRANRVVAHADAKETLADILPLVASRGSKDGTAKAYVCRNFSCRAPVTAAAELASALRG
ncbi:MAG TPA: thioredoxin domain-containing protein [Thermoanaerobaculia bacterium]|nr:thioredoxin domain-containing protein [Thermoanaerobaculia bacterium]